MSVERVFVVSDDKSPSCVPGGLIPGVRLVAPLLTLVQCGMFFRLLYCYSVAPIGQPSKNNNVYTWKDDGCERLYSE